MKLHQWFAMGALIVWAPHFSAQGSEIGGWILVGLSWVCVAVDALRGRKQ